VTLDDIVREAREAFLHLWRNADSLELDRRRLHISGHSAGAHLCGMLLNHDWRAAGLPDKPVASAICSSGIYEPEPVMGTTVNNDVRLTLEMARRNDCVARPPLYDLPLTIIVGGAEPAGWIAQSERYHAACRRTGVAGARLHVVAGANHLNLLHAAAADRALAADVLAQLRAG
jgi:arylformamidase